MSLHQLTRGRIVIYHEHESAGGAFHLDARGDGQRPVFRNVLHLDRNADCECRAFSRRARYGDVAAHQAAELAADGESEPSAAEVLAGGRVSLGERLEQLGGLLRRHSYTGVAHLVDDVGPIAPDSEPYLSLLGELAGVAQQIEEHLPHLGDVGPRRSDGGVDLGDELVSVFLDERLDGSGDVARHFRDGELFEKELHLAGFDLGEIEYVVYEREKMSSGGTDLHQVGDVSSGAFLLGLFLQHLAVTDYGIEGSPQLVAHVGEELALRPAGGFGRASRVEELADVVIERHDADFLAGDDDGDGKVLDVDERAVLAAALAHSARYLSGLPDGGVLGRLSAQLRRGHQLVEISADYLVLRVPEEFLERRVGGSDVEVEIHVGDCNGVVEHERLELLLCGLVQASVLDGYRGLGREELKQTQVFVAKRTRRIGVHDGDRPDEPVSDEQRRGHHRVHGRLLVFRRAAAPFLIIRNGKRLVSLSDVPHRAFAEPHARAG